MGILAWGCFTCLKTHQINGNLTAISAPASQRLVMIRLILEPESQYFSDKHPIYSTFFGELGVPPVEGSGVRLAWD